MKRLPRRILLFGLVAFALLVGSLAFAAGETGNGGPAYGIETGNG